MSVESSSEKRILPYWLAKRSDQAEYDRKMAEIDMKVRRVPRKFPGMIYQDIGAVDVKREKHQLSFEAESKDLKCGHVIFKPDERLLRVCVHRDAKTTTAERLQHFTDAFAKLDEKVDSLVLNWRMEMELDGEQTEAIWQDRRKVICDWMIKHPGIIVVVYRKPADDPSFLQLQKENSEEYSLLKKRKRPKKKAAAPAKKKAKTG
jgi:hypothetical protein